MSRSVDAPPPALTLRPAPPHDANMHVAGRVPTSEPELATVRAALICATRAPSIRNSQPWMWRRSRGGLDLLADDSRWLAADDPSRTDLLLSCGAVLHHARIAFAALGWTATVIRMPDDGEPAHLATLRFRRATEAAITPELLALSTAMTRRFSDHAPYSSWEVPDGIVRVLRQAGVDQGAVVAVVDSGAAIRELVRAATVREPDRDPDRDTGRDTDRDADPTAAPCPQIEREPSSTDEDASIFLVVGAEHPDDESLLRAGEAASAILLEATVIGLATCLVSLGADTLGTRRLVRSTVSPDLVDPCLAVRIGWAHISRHPSRPTQRLPLSAVFHA